MPRVEPDRLAKEAERALPLVELDALVSGERVRVDALRVELRGALEALERGGVVLEVREDVAGCDPGRRRARGDRHEVLREERERSREAQVPQQRRVELHAVEQMRRDLSGL